MRFKKPGRNISEQGIENAIITMAEQHGREFCIDIGSGEDKNSPLRENDLIQTLDIRKEFSPDYVGDMRCLFAPDYPASIDDYPDLLRIPTNNYMLVKLQHVVEHIEWIYQEFMFRWILDILAPGGMVNIATPNLEYIVGVYVVNRKKQRKGTEVRYPIDEHTYFKPGVESDMQRWVNFKMMSGCSPGDYHHCMYDRYWLYEMLCNTGFERISIYDDATLKVVAYKPQLQQFDVNEAIKRATQ